VGSKRTALTPLTASRKANPRYRLIPILFDRITRLSSNRFAFAIKTAVIASATNEAASEKTLPFRKLRRRWRTVSHSGHLEA
jgi:hypothetical protein